MNCDSPSRKERDRLMREEDFLNAAEQLFARNGYFQTSMEDIAREAQYATGTIYRYFESKEKLYQELLHRKMSAYFAKAEEEAEPCECPWEQLKAMIHAKVSFFEANREFLCIYMQEIGGITALPCSGDERSKAACEHYRCMIREIFEAGMARGIFRKMDPHWLTASYGGVSNVILMEAIRSGTETLAAAEAFLVEFMQGALRS